MIYRTLLTGEGEPETVPAPSEGDMSIASSPPQAYGGLLVLKSVAMLTILQARTPV